MKLFIETRIGRVARTASKIWCTPNSVASTAPAATIANAWESGAERQTESGSRLGQ